MIKSNYLTIDLLFKSFFQQKYLTYVTDIL